MSIHFNCLHCTKTVYFNSAVHVHGPARPADVRRLKRCLFNTSHVRSVLPCTLTQRQSDCTQRQSRRTRTTIAHDCTLSKNIFEHFRHVANFRCCREFRKKFLCSEKDSCPTKKKKCSLVRPGRRSGRARLVRLRLLPARPAGPAPAALGLPGRCRAPSGRRRLCGSTDDSHDQHRLREAMLASRAVGGTPRGKRRQGGRGWGPIR
jgi:hypothetical protein